MIYGLAEIERTMKVNTDYLDTLDLTPYLQQGQELYNVMSAIQDDFNDDPNMPAEMCGEPFEFLSEYEFGEYLNQRYGLTIREEVEVRYYLP